MRVNLIVLLAAGRLKTEATAPIPVTFTEPTQSVVHNLVDRFEYSTYGRLTRRVGPNAQSLVFLFNGRYGVMTDANGLYCMGYRYYNPYLRRFLSSDPTGFGGGLNWYAFANGDPASLIDPFGLSAVGESNWSLLDNDGIMGALQFVGGLAEAAFGGASAAGGNPFGLLAAVHGWDTAMTGLDRMMGNPDADTLTSRGLQAMGFEAADAQLMDAGIGIALGGLSSLQGGSRISSVASRVDDVFRGAGNTGNSPTTVRQLRVALGRAGMSVSDYNIVHVKEIVDASGMQAYGRSTLRLNGDVLRDVAGRSTIHISDLGMSSMDEAVTTVFHEIHHIRTHLGSGSVSGEAAAEAYGQRILNRFRSRTR